MDIYRLAITTAEFAGLQLARDPRTGTLSYSRDAVARILRDHDISDAILANEGAVADLLIGWYAAHRQAGGAPNPVMEQLFAEVMAEDEFGVENVQRGSDKPQ